MNAAHSIGEHRLNLAEEFSLRRERSPTIVISVIKVSLAHGVEPGTDCGSITPDALSFLEPDSLSPFI